MRKYSSVVQAAAAIAFLKLAMGQKGTPGTQVFKIDHLSITLSSQQKVSKLLTQIDSPSRPFPSFSYKRVTLARVWNLCRFAPLSCCFLLLSAVSCCPTFSCDYSLLFLAKSCQTIAPVKKGRACGGQKGDLEKKVGSKREMFPNMMLLILLGTHRLTSKNHYSHLSLSFTLVCFDSLEDSGCITKLLK